MNDVIKYNICPLLHYRDLVNMNIAGVVGEELVKKRKEEIIGNIRKLFPSRIIEIVGEDNLLFGTNIEWELKWMGATHYIDRIRYDHLNDTFNYGIDNFGRPFIFIKMQKIKRNEDRRFVLSISQRYTDSEMYVAIDPTGTANNFFNRNVAIDNKFKNDLTDICSGKVPKYILG